jgi:hypothetical protein
VRQKVGTRILNKYVRKSAKGLEKSSFKFKIRTNKAPIPQSKKFKNITRVIATLSLLKRKEARKV